MSEGEESVSAAVSFADFQFALSTAMKEAATAAAFGKPLNF